MPCLRPVKYFLFTLILITHLPLAFCQAPPPAGESGAAQAERFRAEAIDKEKKLKAKEKTGGLVLPEQKEAPPPEEGLTFRLKQVKVSGATLFKDKDFQGISAPFLGKEIRLSDLEKITRGIKAKYNERGVYATNVYLPEQDIMAGVIEIRVLEARMGDVVVNDTGAGALPKLTVNAGATQSITNVNVTNNDASSGIQLVARGTSTLTNATNWALGSTGTTFTWTGAVDTDWNNPLNWDIGLVPSSADTVNIPTGTPNQPDLVSSVTLQAITVNAGGTLTTHGNSLTVTGSMTVNGTLVAGASAIVVGTNIMGSGSIQGSGMNISSGGFIGTLAHPLTISSGGIATLNTPSMNGLVSIAINGSGNFQFGSNIPGFIFVNGQVRDHVGQKSFRALIQSALYRRVFFAGPVGPSERILLEEAEELWRPGIRSSNTEG